jgi:hypothetical protein
MEKTIWDPISQFNIATFLCLSQARPGFPTSYDVEYIQASLSDLTQIEWNGKTLEKPVYPLS